MTYATDHPPCITNSDGYVRLTDMQIERNRERNDLNQERKDEPRRSWSTCTWDDIRKWEKFTGKPAVIGKI